jgi:uncharacterized membrane protein YozB (DUF420 family)
MFFSEFFPIDANDVRVTAADSGVELHAALASIKGGGQMSQENLSPFNALDAEAGQASAGAVAGWRRGESVGRRGPARAVSSGTRTRSTFASRMALAMLAVILIGFGPTFFLRVFFDVPEIPGYLLVHGAVCTAWFVLLLLQTRLVAHGNARWHRRLGLISVPVMVAMVASGIQTSLGMIPRRLAEGMHLDAAELDFLATISSANFSFFIVFPVLIVSALYWRRSVDVHRRLMLVASISIIGPAAMRIASWFAEVPNPINTVIILGFLAALIVHDFATRGRPHRTTVAAAAFVIAVNVAFQLLGIGDAVIAYQMERFG